MFRNIFNRIQEIISCHITLNNFRYWDVAKINTVMQIFFV